MWLTQTYAIRTCHLLTQCAGCDLSALQGGTVPRVTCGASVSCSGRPSAWGSAPTPEWQTSRPGNRWKEVSSRHRVAVFTADTGAGWGCVCISRAEEGGAVWVRDRHKCVCVFSHSDVSDSATPWTVAHQAPLSMGFQRQEYWLGCCFLLQGIFPTQGSKPGLLLGRWILYHELSAKPNRKGVGTSTFEPEGWCGSYTTKTNHKAFETSQRLGNRRV